MGIKFKTLLGNQHVGSAGKSTLNKLEYLRLTPGIQILKDRADSCKLLPSTL